MNKNRKHIKDLTCTKINFCMMVEGGMDSTTAWNCCKKNNLKILSKDDLFRSLHKGSTYYCRLYANLR